MGKSWFKDLVRAGRANSGLSTNWGGRRAGAGRPISEGRRNVPHRRRAGHDKDWPVLVTMRSRWKCLRTPFVFPTLRSAIESARAKGVDEFRICEFSVQGAHIHLLVEAESAAALRRGLRGLAIRIARRVNRLFGEKGAFFDGRYHTVALTTARSVRNALVYVFANFRKHGHGRGRPRAIDGYSSAPYFQGFREFQGSAGASVGREVLAQALAPAQSVPIERPRTWLLARGWKQWGWISISDQPAKRRA